MLIGDPGRFAIESNISLAFEEPGTRALGWFVIYVGGNCYGVQEPDASWLACSYDGVCERIRDRGQHVVSFSERLDARLIADAYLRSVWGSDGFPGKICGLSLQEIRDEMHGGRAVWAPDGDEAFDDRSFVLQFDVGTRVRVIAFRMGADVSALLDLESVRETWLDAEEFYRYLISWRREFEREWKSLPKEARLGEDGGCGQRLVDEHRRLAEASLKLRSSRGGGRNCGHWKS
ncbi:MAG: Imm42 family immunity protein [Verrucomicrobiota bacterium]